MTAGSWLPGRDRRAERLLAAGSRQRPRQPRSVVVIGGGIAGLAAATALSERGVAVTLLERQPHLGGRVRSWPVSVVGEQATMSRGFHAFFRQYYNLRALLRRADPGLERLRPVADYPLLHADGGRDSFRQIPRTPPWNLAGFVATSPSFGLRDLARIDVERALGLLDVEFPGTVEAYDAMSAAEFLDALRFPDRARHLALEVFARSFFTDPADFSAGELVQMFHSYFVGSAEGLLFDVPDDDYDRALWAPLAAALTDGGVDIRTGATASGLDLSGPQVQVTMSGATGNATVTGDAVVVAADLAGLSGLLGQSVGVDPGWAERIRALPVAPPFAVWRLWLDRPVSTDRPAFLGTSGFGPLDNVSVLERFERGAADWAEPRRGSVVELHAYALPGEPGPAATQQEALRRELRATLDRIYPETAGAAVLAEEFRVDRDCPAFPPGSRRERPGVPTPDPRLVLAGDGLACELPVALMERAASTGFQAANTLLAGWDVRGHDLWTTPRSGRSEWPGRFRRLLAAGRGFQPGNSPRRRSS